MAQTIDQANLKAAAEHLEWVLRQYPDNEDVQALLRGLLPLIEEAKAGRVREPVERIPFEYNFADGMYVPYKDPSVGGAYADFATEMRGGTTGKEKQLLARAKAYQQVSISCSQGRQS